MKTSKSKYTPKYKSDKKLNIYEPNSSSMKGFYNTNLNKAKKLYVSNSWKAPGKYKTSNPQKNLNGMLKNYMKDIEKMKKTNNLNYQNEEDLMINPEDFMYKKKEVQKLFESFEPFFEDDDFTNPSFIINKFPEDENNDNQKLKNEKTKKDYDMRFNGIENIEDNNNINEDEKINNENIDKLKAGKKKEIKEEKKRRK